MLVSNSG